ncbi:MAG: flavin reductase family protein [Candidatus Muiribacteriota bacterium]|jgi:ferric-chelate reductase [NAD(P)H]
MNNNVLHKLNYGLYIVCSNRNNEINGCIANTVFQISAQPATIAVSINKQNYTNEFISESGTFAVSILSEEADLPFIANFGFRCGKTHPKFEKTEYSITNDGNPVIKKNTVGFIEAKVIESVDIHTHTLFIGEIIDGDTWGELNPMTYSYYHNVVKGKTPEKAATFIKN